MKRLNLPDELVTTLFFKRTMTQQALSNRNKLISIVETFIKNLKEFQKTYNELKAFVHTDTIEIPSTLLYLVSSLPENNASCAAESGIKNNSFSSLLSLFAAASNKFVICGEIDAFEEDSLFSSVGRMYKEYRKKININLPEFKKPVSEKENLSLEDYEKDDWDFTVYFVLVPVSPSLFVLRIISPQAYSKLRVELPFAPYMNEILVDKLRSGDEDKNNIYFDDIKNQFEKVGKLFSSSEVKDLLNINPDSLDLFKTFINAFEEGEQKNEEPDDSKNIKKKDFGCESEKVEEKVDEEESKLVRFKNKLKNKYERLYFKDAQSYHRQLMSPFDPFNGDKKQKRKETFPCNLPLKYTQLDSQEFTEERKIIGI
jgi:hypothetical protein